MVYGNAMHRMVFMVALGALLVGRAAVAESEIQYSDVPQKSTPRKLQEAWLRFHESDLCQEVDVAFVFSGGRMQVWSRIENDRSWSKLQDLFELLRNQNLAELYINRLQKEMDSGDDGNPPPSLWQNHELRANLGARAVPFHEFDEDEIISKLNPIDRLLKQRLLIYAEQTLGRNRRVERYALDIFALARTVDNADLPPDIRSKAAAICLRHAKSLERNIGKLASDLQQATPRPEKGEKESLFPDAQEAVKRNLADEAERIYRRAQDVAARVHRFFYPEYYTVELDELREPSLFQSFRVLREMALEFQGMLSKSGRKKPAMTAD